MSSDWRQTYRTASEAPHPAVQERVWRALQGPRRPKVGWLVAIAALALAVVVAWHWPRTTDLVAESAVLVSDDAKVTLDAAGRWQLLSGRALVRSWGAPLTVVASGKAIVLESAMAWVEVAGDHVLVEPLQGVVLLDGEVVRRQGLPVPATIAARLARHLPAEVVPPSPLQEEALLVQHATQQLQTNPAGALRTVDEAERRFPQGSLLVERELTRLDGLVALRQFANVASRAEAFIAAHPGYERARHVRALWASALYSAGSVVEACRVAEELADVQWQRRCR